MTTFVLIWLVISGSTGVTSGSFPFATEEACKAAVAVLKEDGGWNMRITAACIADTIPVETY